MTINIAKDYSKTPGGRFIKEGNILERILEKRF